MREEMMTGRRITEVYEAPVLADAGTYVETTLGVEGPVQDFGLTNTYAHLR